MQRYISIKNRTCLLLKCFILQLPDGIHSRPFLVPSSSSRWLQGIWAPSQYPKRRLFVRSRKVSKPRDWYFKLSYRFEIWQAHRQQCCRSASQISERSDNSKYKYRGIETLRDLTERRLFGYWDGAQGRRHQARPRIYTLFSAILAWWRQQMETFPSAVNSPHNGQWRGALIFSLICAWINGWGNPRETGDLRRHRAHYDVIVML